MFDPTGEDGDFLPEQDLSNAMAANNWALNQDLIDAYPTKTSIKDFDNSDFGYWCCREYKDSNNNVETAGECLQYGYCKSVCAAVVECSEIREEFLGDHCKSYSKD